MAASGCWPSLNALSECLQGMNSMVQDAKAITAGGEERHLLLYENCIHISAHVRLWGSCSASCQLSTANSCISRRHLLHSAMSLCAAAVLTRLLLGRQEGLAEPGGSFLQDVLLGALAPGHTGDVDLDLAPAQKQGLRQAVLLAQTRCAFGGSRPCSKPSDRILAYASGCRTSSLVRWPLATPVMLTSILPLYSSEG